jgi:DNA-binding MarR family transcriptional regulator
MADIVELLQQLGFSEYEARAYLALLQRSPLNGYELAKTAGLPRANVYAVLQKLEDRGAVVRQESPDGVRYAPVDPQDLTSRLAQQFHGVLDAAQHELSERFVPPEPAYIWNLQGHAALLDHARALIDGAQTQLAVALGPSEARILADALAQAEQRGVAITTLCLNACAELCGGCRGQLFRYHVAPEQSRGWLILVADDSELLAGEIGGADALAIRTRQALLVGMSSWYIRHSIALAAVLSDLGGQLERLIEPETRAVLEAIGAEQPGGGWLNQMRRLLGGKAR